jgi:hypothetical protein
VIGTTTEREFKPVEGLIPTTPFLVEEAMVEPPVSVAMLIKLRPILAGTADPEELPEGS